ncbi:MAG: HDOD domain-containing protein [Candidatus Polarisedimenticolaceae bacterium]|nr:HDOD domain-containing protein [Candidatus Polarisedimenticolaceae bacterium]
MESTSNHPSVEALQRYHILKGLSVDQLSLLAKSLIIEQAPRGKTVIKRGSDEQISFFLLAGEIELQAKDGNTNTISCGQERARKPIAQLLPRLYDVVAATPIQFIQIDNQLLIGLSQQPDVEQMEFNETFLDSDINDTVSIMKQCLKEDLANEQLSLPSLPDVAVRIGQALGDKVTDAKRIARIIQTDMAMTAKIIRVANSALYTSRNPVENCSNAVVRLGVHTTHQLVLSFALRELFHTKSSIIQTHMQSLWRHSREVAAICYVLAKLTKQFNPEHAMLAGLLHDIGTVVILTYAEKFPDITNNKDHLEHVIDDMRGAVGGMVLRSWGFVDDLVLVTEEAENWQRDPAEAPDYADLVIIAQLHSFIGTPGMDQLPAFDQVPAFHKLSLGEITPRKSLKILETASKQLADAEALLRV